MFGPSQVPTAGEPSGAVRSSGVPLGAWRRVYEGGQGAELPSSDRFASYDPLQVLFGAAPAAHSSPAYTRQGFPLHPRTAAAPLGSRAELNTDAQLKTCSSVHPASKALGGSFISCLNSDTLPATLICSWVYSEMQMCPLMQKERLEGVFFHC